MGDPDRPFRYLDVLDAAAARVGIDVVPDPLELAVLVGRPDRVVEADPQPTGLVDVEGVGGVDALTAVPS